MERTGVADSGGRAAPKQASRSAGSPDAYVSRPPPATMGAGAGSRQSVTKFTAPAPPTGPCQLAGTLREWPVRSGASRRRAIHRHAVHPMSKRWPEHLWIVRHGQSSGNVARDAADAAGLSVIDIAERDVDVPLSPLGEQQASALGRWFAAMPADARPTVVLTSPYVRARQTAALITEAGGLHPDACTEFDERLREKEFGILDRLTHAGIVERFPDQAEARARNGKFYHRPPGGESWCDVILRLRSVLDTLSLHHSEPGSRVLVVAHQVIVLCLRYLIEGMTEEEILAIDRAADVANCGVTEYTLERAKKTPGSRGDKLRLAAYNFVAPLEEAGAPVTARPDMPAARR
jgi:broad specificity phosphatase PhoE